MALLATIFSPIVYPHTVPNFLASTPHPGFEFAAARTASKVTVRIFTKSGSGSGVIIDRKGQNYRVLTNDHVVVDSPESGYEVLTPDGKIYKAQQVPTVNPHSLDLALVEFTSGENYQSVQFSQSPNISEGEVVYVSGFPAWHFVFNGDTITKVETTRDWGLGAFKLQAGKIKMYLGKTLVGGYKVGFTNDFTQGMSGGPVLNQRGELVGISGLLKYPFQGINAFIFTDGTKPNKADYRRIESLSWAIPIATVVNFIQEQKK
ncbi:S1 family peptidase [Cylindrospermopsis curvispora]|uniref:Trypsin-like peptidase domain-containing protein n=1 Tax=Cylindrospermopsis curvispora GIHE-G1 TaxID=2666332 RepID=A0A7H0F204_9CYAN|nr:serine protease [Cylindrospermopsis curvispora]QNP30070.1 trypsin-like peptidase domain-containing protein [Cylindrospermopsis curvispora GIHE-G1]